MHRMLTATAALFALACGSPDEGPDAPPSAGPIDLRAALGADAEPTGIAVDPESGQRFVLDPRLGILELTAEGPVSLWTPDADLPRLTDLCALGGGRFIAAADSDGYLIDVAAGAARQHFCLEPGWDPDFEPEPGDDPAPPAMRHANRSVACDRAAGLIYGQPQTLPVEGEPIPVRSEVASYILETGRDVDWFGLPEADFHAGGMTLLDTDTLLLGAGTALSTFDVRSGALSPRADLADHGVGAIEALAVDGALLLVLGADGRIVSVPLADL